MNQYDKQHKRNLTQYEKQIGTAMEQSQQWVSLQIAQFVTNLSPDKPFRWEDHPVAKQRMEVQAKQLAQTLQQTIENGITQEWALSNQKNDTYTQSAFGEYLQQLPEKKRQQYLNNNQEALEAFKQRKVQGLGLSSRVWNITREYKEEVEMAIDTAVRDGLPATQLATRLKQYLHNPDALFRRVRNRWGELELSKHARAYHPGQGVYRSAYKNARRTAATEINIAYRTSDYDRWQQMDFVVGIEIEPSHTNHPDHDLCDTLAGKYPKAFKFTGWHPHCRCIATPILKTKQEMQKDTERIMQGGEPEPRSKNGVNSVPESFNKWVKGNNKKILNTHPSRLPYFLTDNGNKDFDLGEWALYDNVESKKVNRTDDLITNLCGRMELHGVEQVKVTTAEKSRTEKQLISRIGGRDTTEGSCASLTFVWAANRQGYDVLDFRGGESCYLMACKTRRIVEEAGAIIEGGDTACDFLKNLKAYNLEEGEEYILGVGNHAAIIRYNPASYIHTNLEYLELQGDKYQNHWHVLDEWALNHRFNTNGRGEGEICKCSDLTKRPGFLQLLEYINTNQRKQKKGNGGGLK